MKILCKTVAFNLLPRGVSVTLIYLAALVSRKLRNSESQNAPSKSSVFPLSLSLHHAISIHTPRFWKSISNLWSLEAQVTRPASWGRVSTGNREKIWAAAINLWNKNCARSTCFPGYPDSVFFSFSKPRSHRVLRNESLIPIRALFPKVIWALFGERLGRGEESAKISASEVASFPFFRVVREWFESGNWKVIRVRLKRAWEPKLRNRNIEYTASLFSNWTYQNNGEMSESEGDTNGKRT